MFSILCRDMFTVHSSSAAARSVSPQGAGQSALVSVFSRFHMIWGLFLFSRFSTFFFKVKPKSETKLSRYPNWLLLASLNVPLNRAHAPSLRPKSFMFGLAEAERISNAS